MLFTRNMGINMGHVMDPYEILGIPYDADDATIVACYEVLIRQYPARKYPEKHREIKWAYEKIRSKKGRLEYYLFHRGKRPFLRAHTLRS